jgi:hypothetical protein
MRRACAADDELVIKLSTVGGRSPPCRVSKDRVRRNSQCRTAVFRTSGDRSAGGPPPAGLPRAFGYLPRALLATCRASVKCFAAGRRRLAGTSTVYILAPTRKKSTRDVNVGLPLTIAYLS